MAIWSIECEVCMRHRRKPSQRRPSALAVAHALWADGKFDEALRKFNEAVREAPNEPAVLIEAARALGKRYQIERSERLLERALRFAPRAVAVLHAVGDTYLMIGRPKKAEACFRRACL